MSGDIERKEHVVQYKILGGTFPVVTCNLADGESVITESGTMVWMTPNMEMSTTGGGLGKMFSKAVSSRSRSVLTKAGFCRSARSSLPKAVLS